MDRNLAQLALALSLIFGAGLPMLAQTGQISGEVLDPSGAAVRADIRLINQATLVERHVQTNEAGLYTFPFVPPGQYQLVVEATGFANVLSENLTLTVAQALVFNIQLKVGPALENLEVRAQSQTIDTTDAQVSNVINEQQMESLPTITRNPYQFVLLSAGVNQTNNGDGGYSVNGGRETSSSFLLDGADNNDVEFPSFGVGSINPDSAQEFRIITNNFMPEYGRSAGAVIDVVTKSGNNNWHGAVYEFLRWDALGARDYFDLAGSPTNPYTLNDFGVSIGGPIVKDKTFFFFNYDGGRNLLTRTEPYVVPTQAFLSGKFTYTGQDPTTGATVSVPVDISTPTSLNNAAGLGFDPDIQKIFSFYPAPAVSLGDGIRGIAFSPSVLHSSGSNYTVKVDHNFSLAENFSARYTGGSSYFNNIIGAESLPGFGSGAGTGFNEAFSAQLSSTFSPELQNYLVMSATRYNSPVTCTGLNTINSVGLKDQFGDTSDLLMPGGLANWGCVDIGDSDGQSRGSGSYVVSDHVVRVAGRHTVKFGGGFSDLYSNNSLGFFSRAADEFFNFDEFGIPSVQTGQPAADTSETLQDMAWALFGSPTFQSQSQFFTPAGNRLHTDELNMRARDFSFFGQDSVKALPNLTLNFGLRWEFNGVPFEADDRLSTVPAAALSGPGPITFQNIGQNGTYLFKRNWLGAAQPRVGFAWDPYKNGKTSIRGAVGIFRDRTFFEVADITRGSPPLTESQFFLTFTPNPNNPTTGSGPSFSALFPPSTYTPSSVIQNESLADPFVLDQNLHLPYSENWNFGIQRELGRNTQLELNYIGVEGIRLLRVVDGNQPNPALVQKLRAFCADPTYNPANPVVPNPANPNGCIDSPIASLLNETVQGENLYLGAETPGPNSNFTTNPPTIVPVLPFDAVNNSAVLHPQLLKDAGNSIYNALQATLTKRFSHGLYIQGAYTWAHEIDNASFPLSSQANNSVFPSNSYNLRADRSNGSFDIRQSFVANYVWELPFGKQRAYFNHGLAGKILEGFSLAGITSFQGGFPYDVLSEFDTPGTGGDPNHPDYNPNATPGPVLNPRTQIGPNAGLFSEPPFGRFGNLGRNFFRNPGVNNWDMVLTKTTRLNERFRLDFRVEDYNVFNRVQFAPPPELDTFFEVGELFGQATSEIGRPDGTSGARQLQLALKLKF